MATKRHHLCDICFNQHITEDAIVWCPECEENFCANCKKYHEIAKASRKHETISIENVLNLPRFVQKIKINCTDHDERFLYFCSEHDTPCCIKCIKTNHIDCRNLNLVETVVQDIKQSSSFSDLETTLSDLLTNITNLVEDRKANLQELKKQKKLCVGEIQSARKTINTYFDQLEADLHNKMHQTFLKQETEIEIVLEDIEPHLSKVKQMQDNLHCIKSIASDFQSFMAMRMMSQRAHTEEVEQQDWIQTEKFNWVDISVIPNDIKSGKDNPPSIGTIKVKESCSKVALKMQKSMEAQLVGPIDTSRNIESMQLKEKLKCRIPVGKVALEILDCGMLPNGELIFCDRKNTRLVTLNSEGDIVKYLMLSFCPIRFAIVDKNSIAVTSANKVNIVDFKTGQVLRSFAEGLKARSISLHNDSFIIENLGKGYMVTNLEGNTDTANNIPIKFAKSFYHYPVIIGGKLYYSEIESNELVCCNLEGNQLWKFNHEQLVSPYGIASDNSNFLFVCGFKSNNIFVISADGKTFKEIVAPNEHLNRAIAAYFNIDKQELLVVTVNGQVSLYDVM